MHFNKKTQILIIFLFFIGVFWFSIPPIWDLDIWFHIKSGEIMAQRGIINYDVFSYVTKGREWFPYEWLFQVTVYFTKNIFGLESIKYLVAAASTLMVFLIYLILRRVFNLNFLLSIAICFFFFVSIHEFFAPRPHLIAYTFFIATLYLILLYYFKNKNWLWLSLPVTIAWSNLHGSMFHNKEMINGYSSFIPPKYKYRVEYLSVNFPTYPKIRTLQKWGVDGLVLHKNGFYDPNGYLRIRKSLLDLGVPEVIKTEEISLFDLRNVE